MREVYRHSDAALVGIRQALLEDAGIQTFVRNLNTQQAIVGGVLAALFPIPEFWPTLCVVDDDDYPEAIALLQDIPQVEESSKREWKCSGCEEQVPGNFSLCWNCGQPAEP